MAYKNDYILRLIEQLGVAMARIIFLLGKDEYGEAEALISRTAQSLLGFDMPLLRSLTAEGIAALLRRPDASDVGGYLAAAELLGAQGEIDARRGGVSPTSNDAGYDCNHKALSLYLECYLNAPEVWTDELTGKVSALLDRLRPHGVPGAIQRKLFVYHEEQGDYAQAENVIHQLLEAGEPGAWEEGLAFYERLAAKSDAELARGGLPRVEVKEGLLAFKELAES